MKDAFLERASSTTDRVRSIVSRRDIFSDAGLLLLLFDNPNPGGASTSNPVLSQELSASSLGYSRWTRIAKIVRLNVNSKKKNGYILVFLIALIAR